MSELRKPDVVTVAVTRVDGGVTVLRLIENSYRLTTPAQQAAGAGPRVRVRHVDVTSEWVEYQISRYVADGHWVGPLAPVSWRVVPNEYLADGDDLTFRDAWKDAPGRNKPDVDMPKAREIHRQHLRRLRQPLLDSLDVEYMVADERNPAAKAAIAARKQALRDVTDDPAIEAAQTSDELKAVLPEALRG